MLLAKSHDYSQQHSQLFEIEHAHSCSLDHVVLLSLAKTTEGSGDGYYGGPIMEGTRS